MSGLFQRRTARRFLPFLVGLTVAAGAVWMWRSLAGQEDSNLRLKFEGEAANMSAEIAASFGIRDWTVADLAQRWEKQKSPLEMQWMAAVNDVFAFHRGLQLLAWLGPDFQTRWKGIPPAAEATSPQDLETALALARGILKPESRTTSITPAFGLASAGTGVMIGATLYRGTEFDGFLVYITSMDGLINWKGPESITRGRALAITDQGKEIYRSGTPMEEGHEVQVPFAYKNVRWNLQASPDSRMAAAERSYLPEGALGSGLLLGLMLGLVVHLAQAARHASDTSEVSKTLFRSVFENAVDAMVIRDDDMRCVDANAAASFLLGLPRAQLLGATPVDLAPADEKEAARESIRHFFRDGRRRGSYRIVRSDGATREIEFAATANILPGRHLSIYRDITENKLLQTQLQHKNEELEAQNHAVQEASRLKSEFLANMSHELRTPLNAVVGFAELMLDERVGPVSADQKSCLEDILSSGTHLLGLINDVLDLSKVESGKMEFHPENVNLHKLVAEVRDVVRSMALQKRISIDTFIDDGVQDVFTDPSRLKQVLYNYLSNALKFTPEAGQVRIRIAKHGEAGFCMEVEDTGIGIAQEDIGKLFAEFRQLDAGMSKQYVGTGLGLALTKKIVEAQKGSVTVRSVPGKGSVFGVILPRSSGAPRPPEKPLEKLTDLDGAAVLVIDDDSRDRSWLFATLTEAGCIVEAASTGAQALCRLTARKFDAVTLDLLLPDMSGWEILRELRKSSGPNQHTPVIITTLVAEQQAADGFEIHDFLTKPIDAGRLLVSLAKAAGESRAAALRC